MYDLSNNAPADFARLMEPVARILWGEPNASLSKQGELRWGNKGARIAYTEKGSFLNAETGESGGTLKLIMLERNCDKRDARDFLERENLIEPRRSTCSSGDRRSTFYDYQDADGAVRFRVERRGKDAKPPFLQHGPDGKGGFKSSRGCMAGVQLLPYRLPGLLAAADQSGVVFVCEGEKDVDRLVAEGLTATTNPSGAGKWRDEFSSYLGERRVIVLEDNDQPGRDHADKVVASLRGIASIAGVLRLPGLGHKGDVSDWLDAGNTVAELCRLADDALKAVTTTDGAAATIVASAVDVLPDPVDLWARHDPPPLPTDLLPPIIERFARIQGDIIGVDPGGLAMGALTVCAAAIPDSIRVQVKRHSSQWTESARIWTALIGSPSAKKSPILSTVTRPLRKMDVELYRKYDAALSAHGALPSDEKKNASPPKQIRLLLEDTTIEAAQVVLKDSHQGVLLVQDEMSGWFGAMDKYGGGARGAAADRGFWLQSFNGGPYSVSRIGRGSSLIENLSVSMLGGIQPEPIRKIVSEAADDGLIQRLFPIVLASSRVGKDEPVPDIVGSYNGLIERLTRLSCDSSYDPEVGITLRFDDRAQALRNELEAKHLDLMNFEHVNKKMAAHIGKYDGLFARLCVVWHCIKHDGVKSIPNRITYDTALQVSRFLHEFLLKHAFVFYDSILGVSDNHAELTDMAMFILRHKKDVLSFRDIQRGSRSMRNLSVEKAQVLLEQLELLGWLEVGAAIRKDARRWNVNPKVHTLLSHRASNEKARVAQVQFNIRNARNAL